MTYSYINISEIKLSVISLFSVQIMSYLEASDIIYSDVIDSFISEILKYCQTLCPRLKIPGSDSYAITHLQLTSVPFHIKITVRAIYYTSSKKI